MRRALILLLLVLGLVLPPLASAMSGTMAAPMEDCMGMSSDDCPCCDTKNTCPPQLCALKCHKVVGAWTQAPVRRATGAHDWPREPAGPPGLVIKPEPPPPRA